MLKNKIQVALLIVALSLVLFVSTVSGNSEITIVDQADRTVEISKTPERIVSIAPSNTEILLNLGLVDKIVGVTDFCEYPEVEEVQSVGSLNPVDLEILVALRPDLVVANKINGKETVDKLEQLGIPVIVTAASFLDDLYDTVELIGTATYQEEEAKAVLSEMEEKHLAIRESGKELQEKELKVFFIVHDGEPIWTAGPGSFIDEAINLAGGINIAGDLGTAWAQIDEEEVISQNPDVVLLSGDPSRFTDNPRWETVAAVQKDQVYSVNTDGYHRATPNLLNAILEMVDLLKISH